MNSHFVDEYFCDKVLIDMNQFEKMCKFIEDSRMLKVGNIISVDEWIKLHSNVYMQFAYKKLAIERENLLNSILKLNSELKYVKNHLLENHVEITDLNLFYS